MTDNLQSDNTQSTQDINSNIDNTQQNQQDNSNLSTITEQKAKEFYIPDEKSNIDEVNAFYTKLGRPETIDKYDIPDGLKDVIDNDAFAQFKQICFDKGLTNNQFKEIVNFYKQDLNNSQTKYEENIKQQEKEIKERFEKEFGKDTDAVKNNVKTLLNKYADEKDIEVINSMNEASIITMSRILNNMSTKNLREGNLQVGTPLAPEMSLKDIVDKMDSIKKSDIFFENNKEYQDLQNKKRNLYLSGHSMYNN